MKLGQDILIAIVDFVEDDVEKTFNERVFINSKWNKRFGMSLKKQ